MYEELNLLIPGSLLQSLEIQARMQGVTIDILCLRLLSGQNQEETLIDPDFYTSLSYGQVKNETRKVMESGLPPEQIRKRLNRLETQISRRYRR
jgi:hypothetical protein